MNDGDDDHENVHLGVSVPLAPSIQRHKNQLDRLTPTTLIDSWHIPQSPITAPRMRGQTADNTWQIGGMGNGDRGRGGSGGTSGPGWRWATRTFMGRRGRVREGGRRVYELARHSPLHFPE